MTHTADAPISAYRIDSLVDSGKPFGFALLPGDTIPYGTLEAGRWLGAYSERVTPDAYRGGKVSSGAPGVADGIDNRDDKSIYIEAVKQVIASCTARSGKTVFSREIRGVMGDGTSAGKVFDGLCEEFPDTFRYIFNLPGEGVWMGATPEILLSADLRTGAFSTMALAGTRQSVDADRPWDEKNIIEHRYVSDFIAARLREAGVCFEESALVALPYGQLEHLCRYFNGMLGRVPYSAVLDLLNPTPALCGVPKEAAIADIERFEPHKRGFYGGFVAAKSDTRFEAYANLRCLRLVGKRYAVYAGGGITAMSDPYAEYLETEVKAAPRLALLRR